MEANAVYRSDEMRVAWVEVATNIGATGEKGDLEDGI